MDDLVKRSGCHQQTIATNRQGVEVWRQFYEQAAPAGTWQPCDLLVAERAVNQSF